MCKLFEYDKISQLIIKIFQWPSLNTWICFAWPAMIILVRQQVHKAQKDAIWHIFLDIKIEKMSGKSCAGTSWSTPAARFSFTPLSPMRPTLKQTGFTFNCGFLVYINMLIPWCTSSGSHLAAVFSSLTQKKSQNGASYSFPLSSASSSLASACSSLLLSG